jgi:hypothetical protein
MAAGGHGLFKILQAIFAFPGPVLRRLGKSAINPPVVSARIIATLFAKAGGTSLAGKYFILDDELSSSVPSLDVEMQGSVGQRAMAELELDAEI